MKNNKSSKAEPTSSPAAVSRHGAAATTINGGCYDGWPGIMEKNTNRSRPRRKGESSQTSLAGRRSLLR